MPMMTDVQGHAAGILRKLTCARHDQLHWLINRSYHDVKPEKVMRQLRCLGKAVNDSQYYLWPGCELNPDRIVAVDIMLHICGGALPVFDKARHPCALVFFLSRTDCIQPFLVYMPEEGKETECRTIAEAQREPKGHAAVFYIRNKCQIPLLNVSHPHIFAISDGRGGFEFLNAKL